MSDKKEVDYRRLIKRLGIQPLELLMIENSLKSGVLPVLSIGGHAIHVHYYITWHHETIESQIEHEYFRLAVKIADVLTLI